MRIRRAWSRSQLREARNTGNCTCANFNRAPPPFNFVGQDEFSSSYNIKNNSLTTFEKNFYKMSKELNEVQIKEESIHEIRIDAELIAPNQNIKEECIDIVPEEIELIKPKEECIEIVPKQIEFIKPKVEKAEEEDDEEESNEKLWEEEEYIAGDETESEDNSEFDHDQSSTNDDSSEDAKPEKSSPEYAIKKLNKNHFICLKCENSRQFTSRQSILRHINLKHYEITHDCPKCKLQFSDPIGVKRHLKRTEGKDCRTVKKRARQRDFRNNMEKQGDQYTCKLCPQGSQQYKTIFKIKNHITSEHFEKRFTCSVCNMKFSSKLLVESHNKIEHMLDVKHPCPDCKAEFSSWQDLANHMKSTLESNCVQARKQKNNYQSLIKKSDDDDTFVCVTCEQESLQQPVADTSRKVQKFTTKDSVRRHIRISHYGIKSTCLNCQVQFSDPQSLRNHLKLTDGINCLSKRRSAPKRDFKSSMKKIENYYVCKVCGPKSQQYSSAFKVKRHILAEQHFQSI